MLSMSRFLELVSPTDYSTILAIQLSLPRFGLWSSASSNPEKEDSHAQKQAHSDTHTPRNTNIIAYISLTA